LRDARWWGLSGLAAYKLTPRFEVVSRLDYINNHANGEGLLGYNVADPRNGFGPDQAGGDPNIGANRYALAIGFNYLLTLNTTIKAEYRLDRATQAVFLDTTDNSYRKSNQLLGASLVVGF
jgi:hypothetical protein